MTSARLPNVAGIGPSPPRQVRPSAAPEHPRVGHQRPVETLAAVQDRLASWLSDLTTLQELNDRLVRADSLDTMLHELLQAGAALVGARRGVAVLEPADGRGPELSVGLGLQRADIGTLETVPLAVATYGRAVDAAIAGATATPGETAPAESDRTPEGEDAGDAPTELLHGDIATDGTLPERHRAVAARLGVAACYARRLVSASAGALGCLVWMYDEPAEPTDRQRHLAELYCTFAAELVAKQLRLTRSERDAEKLRTSLLPARLPHIPGVRLGVRHHGGPDGGDWYDALALPEGALGLTVGRVTGGGPEAAAAMGRLRSALRGYAVLEGEDPVAVLADLELLLDLTEPARSATALFAYAEPAERRITLAGAGHCPPLLVGEDRLEFVETSLSAPLGMLSCWEAPSVQLTVRPGETLVLYTDGLLCRRDAGFDQALEDLRKAAELAPPRARRDPGALCEHLLAASRRHGGQDTPGRGQDAAVLAARFD